MKVENYGFMAPEHKKRRFNEVFPWIVGLDAYDYADPGPLATLMAGPKPVPEELRSAIAAIISGERRPNKRAAAKLKVPAAERMKIAGSISVVIGLADLLKTGWIIDPDLGEARAIDVGASRRRREPIDEVRELEGMTASLIEEWANDLGVSIETVENLLRDLRKKIENFPDV